MEKDARGVEGQPVRREEVCVGGGGKAGAGKGGGEEVGGGSKKTGREIAKLTAELRVSLKGDLHAAVFQESNRAQKRQGKKKKRKGDSQGKVKRSEGRPLRLSQILRKVNQLRR